MKYTDEAYMEKKDIEDDLQGDDFAADNEQQGIRTTEETTYTMLPSDLAEKLIPVLDAQNSRYTILYGDDIPVDLEKVVDMDGHKMRRGVCCLKSNFDPDDVHELMLRTWLPSKYGMPR